MTRPSLLFRSLLLSTLAACGAKSNPSICDQASVTPNPVCNTACNPNPGAPESCPAGYHCDPDGKCDAQCDATHPCPSGFSCDLSDGTCHMDDTGSGMFPDANCPSVHVAAMPTTPSVLLVIDRSGSMDQSFGGSTRYLSVRDALVGGGGVVSDLQSKVYFGAAMYYEAPACPGFDVVPRALNNQGAISTLFANQAPSGNTPTPLAIDKAVADFAANPAPMGSPPIIVLATDGEPNKCGDNTADTRPDSVMAASRSYAAGIPLYILSVGADVSDAHLQDMANAGQGVQPGQPNAMFYRGNNPTELKAAFNQIIGGVLSCDLQLNSQVDPAQANATGSVTVNGMPITQGTGWVVDNDGKTLHILGASCDSLKNSASPTVDAVFGCGTVIF